MTTPEAFISPEAFTTPEVISHVLDDHWEMTPRVRQRLVEQLSDLTAHEVILRLVYQLANDYGDYGDGTGGEWGGAWLELRVINGQRRQQLHEIKPEQNTFHSYAGVCPQCGTNDGYVNAGKAHWFVCHQHRVCWGAGSNLFSTWKRETEAEQRHAHDVDPGWGAYREIVPWDSKIA